MGCCLLPKAKDLGITRSLHFYYHFFFLLLSVAEGQRPRRVEFYMFREISPYQSITLSWIFRLIYALSTPTTMLPPIFLNFLKFHLI